MLTSVPPSLNVDFNSFNILNNVTEKLSSFENSVLNLGAVIFAPSKQGSTSSPKIHNLEKIASFIMKKSIPRLLSVDQ